MLFVSDIFMTPPIGVRDADSMIAMFPDFGNDSPYLFTPMYEASFKGTKR